MVSREQMSGTQTGGSVVHFRTTKNVLEPRPNAPAVYRSVRRVRTQCGLKISDQMKWTRGVDVTCRRCLAAFR